MLLLVPRCQDCAKQKPALDVVYEDFERKQVTLLGHRLFREAQERQSA
ncbi:MAG: hypothetical protein IT384_00870 [Deltaproteobacteria bacterium]|nr:hypothetical protein [Deltaproteobacteria bacterium]